MRVEFKKMELGAVIPTKATDGACGFDLVCTHVSHDDTYVECKTGIAVAIPEGYVGLLFARSSISKTGWSLACGVGVIDQDFRGGLSLRFTSISRTPKFPYKEGDRVGQLVIVPATDVEFQEVSELGTTERGDGGYGSTDS